MAGLLQGVTRKMKFDAAYFIADILQSRAVWFVVTLGLLGLAVGAFFTYRDTKSSRDYFIQLSEKHGVQIFELKAELEERRRHACEEQENLSRQNRTLQRAIREAETKLSQYEQLATDDGRRLVQDNERMRAALRYYAAGGAGREDQDSPNGGCVLRTGATARAALEGRELTNRRVPTAF